MKYFNIAIYILAFVVVFFLIRAYHHAHDKLSAPVPVVEATTQFYVGEAYITGYSSEPPQTDSDPYITATNQKVFDGGVAVSEALEKFAPMRSYLIIDGKSYRVNDRMNKRISGFCADIWFKDKQDALDYGRRKSIIVVVIPKADFFLEHNFGVIKEK